MSELLSRLEALSRPKRALLAERNPLSFAQQRLWFLDQLEPGSHLYNVPLAVRLDGALAVPALAGALAEIVRRHQVLRSLFPALDGRPLQVVVPAVARQLPFRVVDLRIVPEAARQAEATRLAAAEARRAFRLASEPPCRFTLLDLGRQRHLFLLIIHHIAADGWSFEIVVRELAVLYPQLAVAGADGGGGRGRPLPELPLQYADYARWQRRRLQGETLEALLAYWRRQLAELPALLELPADRPRPPAPSYRGGSRSLTVAPALVERLRELARASGATLFMTLLAAFSLLLRRAGGRADVAVGTPMVNRDRVELERLIGLFQNMLVLRLSGASGDRFDELLAAVRETVLTAHAHQELPFERLVDELQPDRALNRQPLFQVMFTLRAPQARPTPVPGVAMAPLELAKRAAKFDLTLSLTDREGGLDAVLEYSADLFDATTAERLLSHFATLLEEAAAHPRARVASLRLLRPAERLQLVAEWNDAGVSAAAAAGACVHELFEAQAARVPGAVAAVCEGRALTYAELDRRAERLARRLRELGVAPEALVGVHLDRSLEMLVAVLGVLKAGGAYVPLDPAFPRERLALMLGDAGLGWVVTARELAPAVGELSAARLVVLDPELEEVSRLGERESSRRRRGAGADALAYVIYTSGSTGRPKGVQVPHRGVVSFLEFMGQELGLGERDRLLAVTTLSFDIAALELFLPLTLGARVEIAGRETASDGAALAARIAASGATVMQATPATWQMLVDAGWRAGDGLKMLCGGEALSPELAVRLGAAGGPLWNVYGPTETTIWSTVQRVRPAPGAAVGGGPVPIGLPIAGTVVHLLGPHGEREPAPVGFPGELHVGGVGVARGYLGRPDLTAERFVPDPFGARRGEAGARLYRTGDLARRRPDGSLDFLGRIDRQVKVRGFRVEPGEIEARLLAHAAVREAVVVARRDASGHGILAAYMVAAGDAPPVAAELRAWLREALPEYMVPSVFVPLAALPLTPNGKVDRDALPAPPAARPGPGGELAAPRTPTEEVVAGVWAEVLGREGVGIHDGFFDLGGHSLLATQVVSRLREGFGIELPLRSLFEGPTVAELAAAVDGAVAAGQGFQAPPLEPAPRQGDPPLSLAQQRLWFLDQLEPGKPFYNLATAVRLQGALEVPAMAAALAEVARRHESLRTCFPVAGGRPVQRVLAPAPVTLPVVDLSGLPPAARDGAAACLLREEAERSFDLARGPLLRVRLLRLAAAEHAAAVTLHHIVGDRWSMAVLVHEIAALYAARAAGAAAREALPELPVQYADFALWQRRWLDSGVLERQLAYWRRRLAGSPPLLALPADRPRPAVPSRHGARHALAMPAPLVAAARKLSRAEGVTLFMTLLAALQAVLAWASGCDDVVIGGNVANRNHSRTERLIGFFANLLVLRTDLSGDPTFRELLARVREVALGAYAHQDVPFDRLVEELQPRRDPGYSPLVQVVLSFQNVPAAPPASGPLVVTPIATGRATAKFDLVLDLAERNGQLTGSFEYSTDLFAATTIAGMAARYEALLAAAAARPDATLGQLRQAIAEAERERRSAEAERFASEDAAALAGLRRRAVPRSAAS